jgi:hypothetical protein
VQELCTSSGSSSKNVSATFLVSRALEQQQQATITADAEQQQVLCWWQLAHLAGAVFGCCWGAGGRVFHLCCTAGRRRHTGGMQGAAGLERVREQQESAESDRCKLECLDGFRRSIVLG